MVQKGNAGKKAFGCKLNSRSRVKSKFDFSKVQLFKTFINDYGIGKGESKLVKPLVRTWGSFYYESKLRNNC